MHKRHKSEVSHAILDAASRKRKAEKIVKVLEPRVDLSAAAVLDIGTGAGYIAEHLAQHAGAVTSVDLVDERQTVQSYDFKQIQDESLPFADGSFDVVVSNHVIEHVQDQARHVTEVCRVLKPGGVAYFATPNRLWISDPHYRLVLVNWLPRPLAQRYVRATRGKVWDIQPVTLRRLRRLSDGHEVTSVAPDIIKNPTRYSLDVHGRLQRVAKLVPMPVLKAASNLAPTILVVVTKRD